MKQLCLTLTLFITTALCAQQRLQGVVADSVTRGVLPFATIRIQGEKQGIISGMNGRFSLTVPGTASSVTVSYIGHRARTVAVSSLQDNDTVFLSPAAPELDVVVVRSQSGKVTRIVNAAVRNKEAHNPERYSQYACHVYYKMYADILPSGTPDTAAIRKAEERNAKQNKEKKAAQDADTGFNLISDSTHLLFSETYSERFYKRPQQLQEVVLASRFSGLPKTYFTNVVTDVLPFHVYSDFINLNDKDYSNPVAKGWQQRYNFTLSDEMVVGTDTVFMLTFAPRKGAAFNALNGMVYINSNGYAISHFIANTGDTASGRNIRVEQIYTLKNSQWFPQELNYEFTIQRYPMQGWMLQVVGHSVISSIAFALPAGFRFNKAYPVQLHDSVDLRTKQQWQAYRADPLTSREANTYRIMDSLTRVHHLDKVVNGVSKLTLGKLPIGVFDLDVNRLATYNEYEGTRLGAGLYTNEKISKYFSLGGWGGYGLKDKTWKYGASATLYPRGDKETWLTFGYQDNYRNPGDIIVHPDLDRPGVRNLVLVQVDQFKEYAFTAGVRAGYWELRLNAAKQDLHPLYNNNFIVVGKKISSFASREGSVGLRYAYGEKRAPVFGTYVPLGTKYPVAYLRAGRGTVSSGAYTADYWRVLGAVTYEKHTNRWGNDRFKLEGGMIRTDAGQPLSRSFLLAGNGFKTEGINYYAFGGFLTMRPFDYYADQYASFMYRHDLDRSFWQNKWSKPYPSLAHNLIYGSLSAPNRMTNGGIATYNKGYHESGLILNQLLKINFTIIDLNLHAGAFYHWNNTPDWNRNGTFVVGISAGF